MVTSQLKHSFPLSRFLIIFYFNNRSYCYNLVLLILYYFLLILYHFLFYTKECSGEEHDEISNFYWSVYYVLFVL
jgi:Ca2+/Na+ antiporter